MHSSGSRPSKCAVYGVVVVLWKQSRRLRRQGGRLCIKKYPDDVTGNRKSNSRLVAGRSRGTRGLALRLTRADLAACQDCGVIRSNIDFFNCTIFVACRIRGTNIRHDFAQPGQRTWPGDNLHPLILYCCQSPFGLSGFCNPAVI